MQQTTDHVSTWAELLREAVTQPGRISEAYRRFHGYSLGNQLLALGQCHARKIQPGPIATFVRWKELGRHVKRGEKALTLCMPVTIKRRAEDASEEDEVEVCQRFAYRRNWFVLSQTDGDDYAPPALPGWDRARAVAQLGIQEIEFDLTDGSALGYASRGRIAVSPLSPFPHKTTFHELAHGLLHLDEEHREGAELPRNVKEVEAEAVALLCCEALGLDGSEYARGYMQHWLRDEAIPESNARRIFGAADRILRAGRGDVAEGQS